MFYGQCWKCGERWELGTASTCKCPEETTIDWKDYSIPVDKMPAFSIGNIKPNYNMTFHRDDKQIGVLDFNGPEMTFTGDADESAKVFFDWIAKSFKARLEQERADERNRTWTQEHWTEYERSIVEAEREACARVCDEQAERSKLVMEKSKRTTDYAVYRAGAQTAAWNAAEIRARSNT